MPSCARRAPSLSSRAVPVIASLRVPVEIRQGARWFRLAEGVSEGGMLFLRALPEEMEEVVDLTFHLPEDPEPIGCRGRVVAAEVDERDPNDRRRAVRFLALDEPTRARIARYVEERVPS
ncbi:MAG: PilZ domain-containing protein [Myxococcales bacterium]|nr:PilZ domain-containing protein [Myxococcales bacterium]